MRELPHQRNELEIAVWMALSGRVNSLPPRVFLNRIKRLLDLDDDKAKPVFPVEAPGGKGRSAKYGAFGSFLMVIGLRMIDAGLTQGDVIFVLRNLKSVLLDAYENILKNPPSPLQHILARDQPQSPTMPDQDTLADTSVFFLLRKVELKECFNWQHEMPLFINPKFCYGLKELYREMKMLNYEDPVRLVVQISDLAITVREHLKLVSAKRLAKD
jgi:hypothetical protein